MTPQDWLIHSEIEPLPGDFIVERGKDLISSLIAWREGGIWSHVSIPVSSLVKVESHMSGGYRAGLLNFNQDWGYMRLKPEYQLAVDERRWKERLAWHAIRKTAYDVVGIWGAFFNVQQRQNPNAYYCSELLSDVLYHASGLQIAERAWPWPDRCYESGLYDLIGFNAKRVRVHSDMDDSKENKEQVKELVKHEAK